MTEHHVISGRQFVDALLETGVIRLSEKVQKVVIEADHAGLVLLHVQRVGDDRLLQVIREGGLHVEEQAPPRDIGAGPVEYRTGTGG